MYPLDGEKYSIQNVASFITNILTFATFAGLGSCWVAAYENDVLKEFLNIPSSKKVDAIIPLGYSLEKPTLDKSPITRKMFYEEHGNYEK